MTQEEVVGWLFALETEANDVMEEGGYETHDFFMIWWADVRVGGCD